MDISQIRTFIEIVNTGSFVNAAERLHVTQTAVTARVRSLESQLGAQLFVRNRSGAKLTVDGESFLSFALTLSATWSQAICCMGLPDGHNSRLRVGCEISLWQPLLVKWLSWVRVELPAVTVDTKISDQSALIDSLNKGHLDIAIVHTPNFQGGYTVEQILEEKLIKVMNPVASEPNIYVEWGRQFESHLESPMNPRRHCAFSFDLGPAALQFMLEVGGNGWFRTRVVEPYLQDGRLVRAIDAPEFAYPVYLIYRANIENENIKQALDGVRNIVASAFKTQF